MYKPETIERAASLLNMMDAKGNPVIEVNFNDKTKTIEVWNMLADDEHIIAMADYPEEQKEATSLQSNEEESDPSSCTGIGGNLIPVLLRAVVDLVSKGENITDQIFTFDAEHEELVCTDDEDNKRSWSY